MDDIPKFEDTEEIVEEVPEFDATEALESTFLSPTSERDLQTLMKPDISEKESFLRGGAQGATLGFADELEAAIRTPFSDKSYSELQNIASGQYKAAEEANPKLYMAGDLTASLATPGGALKAASKVKKGKQLLDSYKGLSKGKQAATLLAAGGVEGLGRGEGEDLVEKGMDVAEGATLSGLGGILGKLGEKGIRKIAGKGDIQTLRKTAKQNLDEANTQALRSIEAPKDTFREGLETVTKKADVQPEDLTGAVGLKEGIIGANVSPDEAYAKAQVFRKKLSDSYEKNLDSLKGYAVKDPDEALAVADEMHKEIYEQIDNQIKDIAGFDEKTAIDLLKKADELKDDIQVAFLSENPLKELHNLYAKYNKYAFKNRGKTSDIAKVLRNSIKKRQRDLIQELEPDVAQNLSKLDKEYGAALDLDNITEEFATRARQKGDKITLGDWVGMGVLSSVTRVPGIGPAYLGASKGIKKATGRDISDLVPAYSAQRKLEKYQSQLDKIRKMKEQGIDRTRTSNIINKVLDKGSEFTTSGIAGARAAQATTPFRLNEKEQYLENQKSFMKSNSSELTNYADKVRGQYGQIGEALAMQLDKASETSPQQKKALLMKILQDPTYRKMLNVDREK